MKKLFLQTVVMLVFSIAASAQAPAIFNYQAVARNPLGNALSNKTMQLRITILDGSATGPSVYSETRTVTTNAFGLFSVQIGSGGATNVSGTVTGVNWATGFKYIKVETDQNNGQGFQVMGSSMLASVPYALNAGTAPPSGAASGDLTGTYPAPTLVTTGVTAGTYGNATNYPTFTVDAKGRILSAGNIALPATLPPSGPASGDLTGTYPAPTLVTTGVTAGTYGNAVNYPTFTADAKGRILSAGNIALPTSLPPSGAASGDLTGTYPAPTLVTTGVTAGTYGNAVNYPTFTTDAKGRILSAGNLALPTSLPPSGAASGDLTGTYPAPSLVNTGITAGSYGSATTYPTFIADAKGRLLSAGSFPLPAVPASLPPSGPAGGDLSGTYPNPKVVALQGFPVAATTPAAQNLLVWNGTAWAPGTAVSAGLLSGNGTLNFIPKWTPNGTTLGNSKLFDDGTNVGVGTTTPNTLFSNNGTNNLGSDATGLAPGSLNWSMNSAGYAQGIYNGSNGSSANGLLVKTNGTTLNNKILDLSTGAQNANGTSVMVVRGDGNVGINNASPQAKLDLTESGTAAAALFTNTNPANVQPVIFAKTNSTTNNSFAVRGQAGGAGALTALIPAISGVVGETTTGWGVTGISNTGNGVYGATSGTGTTAAVTGQIFNAPVGSTAIALRGVGQTGNTFALRTETGKVAFTGLGEAAGKVFSSNATGEGTWQTLASLGAATGTGTLNTVPKWTSATALGNSQIIDNGTGVGIGVTPTAKLDVAGTFKLADGTQAAGAVLTSNSTGNASWVVAPGISMRTLSATVSVPSGSYAPITQWAIIDNEDGGSNYNNTTGEYTIPRTGVYLVNASIFWPGTFISPDTRTALIVNGIYEYETIQAKTTTALMTTSFTYSKRFTAGQRLSVYVAQTSGSTQTTGANAFENSFSVQFLHN